MRLVMDVLFCDTVEFELPVLEWNRCRTAVSQEEVLRSAMLEAGIELIDYGSFMTLIIADTTAIGRHIQVRAYSKAWRSRLEREAYAR